MLEYLIVGLIVAAAAFYVLRKYLPKPLRARLFGKAAGKDEGCGSGCGSCSSGCESPAETADTQGKRVIPLRRK